MTKEDYLDAAWESYKSFGHSVTLGACIRNVCPQMRVDKHNILSRLDAYLSIEYFNDEWKQEGEIK